MGKLILKSQHRVLCGDSTNASDVERAMNGERAVVLFTDPPYGVSIGTKNRFLNEFQPSNRRTEEITSDTLSPDELKQILLPALRLARSAVMRDDCCVFVTAPQGGELGTMMLVMMSEAGLPVRHVLIWRKNQPTFSLGRLDYDYQHEPILMTWGKSHKRLMHGEHHTSVWNVDKPRASKDHPTQKPVALYVNAYMNHSELGDVVADIYGGSGTAVLAAEQTHRRAVAIELDPGYCDVIVRRWQEFTGKQAIRQPAEAAA